MKLSRHEITRDGMKHVVWMVNHHRENRQYWREALGIANRLGSNALKGNAMREINYHSRELAGVVRKLRAILDARSSLRQKIMKIGEAA